MKKYIIGIVLFVLVLAACQPNKDKRLEEIAEFELQILKDAKSITISKADSLLVMYDRYIIELCKCKIL